MLPGCCAAVSPLCALSVCRVRLLSSGAACHPGDTLPQPPHHLCQGPDKPVFRGLPRTPPPPRSCSSTRSSTLRSWASAASTTSSSRSSAAPLPPASSRPVWWSGWASATCAACCCSARQVRVPVARAAVRGLLYEGCCAAASKCFLRNAHSCWPAVPWQACGVVDGTAHGVSVQLARKVVHGTQPPSNPCCRHGQDADCAPDRQDAQRQGAQDCERAGSAEQVSVRILCRQ